MAQKLATKKSKAQLLSRLSKSKAATKESMVLPVFNSNLLYFLGLGVVLILIVFIRINFLEIPFERDEGFYAYSGKSILEGAKSFIDIGSQRLDGIYYVYAFLVAVFGYSVKALHIAFLFINLGTAILLFFLTRKLLNNLAALAAAAFFALLSMIPAVSGFTIQSEHIVAFFISAAFLTLVYFFENKKIWLLVVSGILFSLAFQVKQTSFFYGVLAGLLITYKGFIDDKRAYFKILRLITIFSLSVLLPLAADLGMVYHNGAWSDFKLWFFDIRNQYMVENSFSQGLGSLRRIFHSIYKDYQILWIISFLGTAIVFFTTLELWKKITIACLMVFGFLTVIPGYHFYGHYFLQWIPAVSLCGGAFIFSIFDIAKTKFNFSNLVLPLIIILLAVGLNIEKLKSYYFSPNYTQVLRDVYGLNPFPESKVIADKLNSIMKSKDRLAVFGSEPQMYVYTNKISSSRFSCSGILLEFPHSQNNAWQKEFISNVEKAAPKYLVFFLHRISWMADPKVENLIFPWFDKFIAKSYKVIGFADMYNNITNYVWEPNIDLVKNPPKSKFIIYIFERKEEIRKE